MKQQHPFLLRLSGELSLKGKKIRHRFVDRLVHNLADALRSRGFEYRIDRRWSRIVVEACSPEAGDVAATIFGVKSVAAMERRSWRTLHDLLDQGEQIFTPDVAGRTFAVRVHRGEHANKIAFTSPEAERALGSRLYGASAGVDLKSPEVEAHVELRGDEACFYARPRPAEGGLPLGTGGRALALFSGGFDSPVAAWSVMRRGVALDLLFFNLGGEGHLRDVLGVAKTLADGWCWGTRPKLIVIDARPLADELRGRVEGRYRQVVLKRQMLRIASTVAQSLEASALITGEAIGQVSSQTLDNLAVTGVATTMPVLRPLVAWNKEEIFAIARRIGTFDGSSRVDEYCGLETSMMPETRAERAAVEEQEARLDECSRRRWIDERVVFDLRALRLAEDPSLEVEKVPEGAVLLDLRSPRAFASWHADGARLMPYPEALESFRELDPQPVYVAFCEIGIKSAHLAEVMTRAGYRAHHLRGGAATLQAAQDGALLAALSPTLLEEGGQSG